jgi:hypothetical protein
VVYKQTPKEGRYRVITIINIPKKESKEGLKQVMIVGSDVDGHADGQSGTRGTGGSVWKDSG